MDIQITPKESTGVERHLDVSIPAEAVAAAEDTTARRYTSQARLPGFRPGKAPPAMVRKRFANEIRQDALQSLVQEAYQKLMEQEKVEPITQPHIHDLKFEPGQPLTFTFHFEVRPEVSLANVEGFTIDRPSTEVTDEMVTQQFDQMRDQRATWAPVEEAPQAGDKVTLDLSVTEADGNMSEPQTVPDFLIGQGQAIPGVEAIIMEAAPGQTVEREVTWPDDFPVEEERGKTKTVRVTTKEVKRKVLPALDDAFAREMGDFDSLDAFTSTVRGDLGAQLTRDRDAETRAKLLDAVIDANPFDVPPTWVNQLSQSYAQAYQVPQEQLPMFAEQFRPLAERQVRRDLVVDTLAKAHGLEASSADVDAEIESMAQQRGMEPGALYSTLQKNNRLAELEHGLTERKVFEWLTARNTIRDVEASATESETPSEAPAAE